MNDLVPYGLNRPPLLSQFLLVREDPLTALTRELPQSVSSILNRQIDLGRQALRTQENLGHLETIQSMSHDAAADACTWLQTRPPNETEFDYDVSATVTQGGFFSSNSTTVRFSKRIRTR